MALSNTAYVYFVGAGPGDPDLLSIKGKDALSQADVVLYDFLAHPHCLSYTRHNARLICVGKRKNHHGKTQKQINRLLGYYAKKGACIVRLKGGDPMIFGRISEELAVLHRYGIPYSIVPGISALQGAASVGIPLTHRSESRSFAVLTGTTWQKSALPKQQMPDADMLVVFMPSGNLPSLLDSIVSQTRHRWDSHVAIVYYATSAHEQVTYTTLEQLRSTGIRPLAHQPALLLIGKNVRHYHTQKTDIGPLRGWRLYLTAEEYPMRDSLRMLKRLGLECCHLPLTYHTPLALGKSWSVSSLLKADYLVFSSPRAVTLFFLQIAAHGIDIRNITGEIAVVGQQTAQTVRDHGLQPVFIPKVPGAQGLCDVLPPSLKGKTIHLYGAKKPATDMAEQLRKRNGKVQQHALYATAIRKTAPVLPPFHEKDIVFFSSPSQIDAFITHYPQHAEAIPHVLSIGETTYAYAAKTVNSTHLYKSPASTYNSAFQHLLTLLQAPPNNPTHTKTTSNLQNHPLSEKESL